MWTTAVATLAIFSCALAQGPPNAECETALREFCGRAKYENVTACHECIIKNAATLKTRQCTETVEAEFCSAVPPGPNPVCQAELVRTCGQDRNNASLCTACVEEHKSEIKNCTTGQEEEFCRGPPKPPAPSPECDTVLTQYCGATRRANNRTACAECAVEHRNETEKAHCTFTQIQEFCHPASPPSKECEMKLFDLCGHVRYNHSECIKCEEAHEAELKNATCTSQNEDDFCSPARPPAPPPAPNGACIRALDQLCGKDHGNRTACFHCVDENNATLRHDNCTYKEIDYFCDATPPATTCLEVEEHYCGVDRHNKSLCESCLTRHRNQTTEAKCTASELSEFCTPEPPVPPEQTCRVELEHYCGMDRHTPATCEQCITDHEQELKAAHCDAAEEHAFCTGPVPPQPSATCEETLKTDCSAVQNNRTACVRCADEHQSTAHCTFTQIEAFCHLPVPPNPECEKALFTECGVDRKNKTECLACEKKNAAVLAKANCTTAWEEEFCYGAGPGPKPVPGGKCFPALEQLCDHEKANRTLCIKCVDENAATLKKDNCTYEDIDKFCDITPPAYTCKDVLERDCAVDRKNESLCMKCIARHANETAKAKCTETEEKEFCAASPTPDPTACNKYLFDNCRDEHDSGNHTLCVRCTSEHTAGEKAADCTVKEVTDFCENAPKPPPADKCHTALENLCGIDIDPHACTECTVKNKAPLAAAGCTEQEEIQFCNK